MRLSRGVVAKWVVLTIVANALGAGIGALYAMSAGASSASAVAQPPSGQTEPVEPSESRGHPMYWDHTPPTTPLPESPSDGAITNLTPRFTWKASEDENPIMYILEFSNDPEFSLGTVTSVHNIYTNSWQTPTDRPFPLVATTYWRVYTVDSGANESERSPASGFTPLPIEPAGHDFQAPSV